MTILNSLGGGLDPFIWLDNSKSLRRRSFQPGEFITLHAGGKVEPEPGPTYYLDATFHRYGPLGPEALLQGAILDDTGAAAAVIDKGSITLRTLGANGTAVLQNEKIEVRAVGAFNFDIEDQDTFPTEIGLTFLWNIINVTDDFNGAISLKIAPALGDASTHFTPEYSPVVLGYVRLNALKSWAVMYDLQIPWTTDLYLRYIIGGYDATGQPDPLGIHGHLIGLADGAINYSSPDDLGVSFSHNGVHQNQANEFDINAAQTYVDTKPLATPVRSLFAQDHAAISDYQPESGAKWAEASANLTGMKTLSGAMHMIGTAADMESVFVDDASVFNHFIEADFPANWWHSMLFRYAAKTNRQDGFVWWQQGTLTKLYEYVGGVQTDRGTLNVTTNNGGRKIVTDDGSAMTVIHATDGAVFRYASTSMNTNNYIGIEGLGTGALCNYFCTRKG